MISVRCVEKLSIFPLGGLYILIIYIAFVHGLLILISEHSMSGLDIALSRAR